MRNRITLAALFVIALAAAGAARLQPGGGGGAYTTNFGLLGAALLPVGANALWTLQPGKFRRYEGDDGGELVELKITVLPETKWIKFQVNGVDKWAFTRVIEEREWLDGELVEVSRNYFARDAKTGNVYYFGENVDIYENGVIVGHDGTWRAGFQGARPGLMMPSIFLIGSRYFQEIAPGVAMDRAEHHDMGVQVVTPAGTFSNCVVVRETTPLEPGSEGFKIYAPGVGLIKDGPVELVEYN